MASPFPPNGLLTLQVTSASDQRDTRGNLTPVVEAIAYQVYVAYKGTSAGQGSNRGIEASRMTVEIRCVDPLVLAPSITTGQKGQLTLTDPSNLQSTTTDEVLIELLPASPWGLTEALGQKFVGVLLNRVSWSNG